MEELKFLTEIMTFTESMVMFLALVLAIEFIVVELLVSFFFFFSSFIYNYIILVFFLSFSLSSFCLWLYLLVKRKKNDINYVIQ